MASTVARSIDGSSICSRFPTPSGVAITSKAPSLPSQTVGNESTLTIPPTVAPDIVYPQHELSKKQKRAFKFKRSNRPSKTQRFNNFGSVVVDPIVQETAYLKRTVAPAARPTARLSSFPQVHHRADENDDDEEELLLSKALHLVPLPEDAVSVTSSSPTTATWWPCLVFSNAADASTLHYKFYHKQELVHRELTKLVVKEMRDCTNLVTAENDTNKENTFAVVLPLRNAKGCHKPLYNVDATSALKPWQMMIRYHKELNLAQSDDNPARYKALVEVQRLLSLEVPSDDEAEEDTLKRKNGYYGKELEAIRGKRFRFQGFHHGNAIGQLNPWLNNKSGISTFPSSAVRLNRSIRFCRPSTESVSMDFNTENTPVAKETSTCKFGSLSTNTTMTTPMDANGREESASIATNFSPAECKPEAMSKKDASSETASGMKTPSLPRKSSQARRQAKFPTKSSSTPKRIKTKTNTSLSKSKQVRLESRILKASGSSSSKHTRRESLVSSDDQTKFTVPSWDEVRPILELFGFTFPKNLFCRPNGDPTKNPTATLGKDYFLTLDDFRDNLCAIGIEFSGTCPLKGVQGEADKKDMIKNWVITAIVTKIRNASAKQKNFYFQVLSPVNVRERLEYFGIMERRSYHWAMPWVQPNEIVTEEEGVMEYLGRHGIPKEFREKIDAKELASLEFHIASKFSKNDGNIFIKRTHRFRNRGRGPETHCTPPATKDALEACTRAPPTEDQPSEDFLKPKKLLSDDESPDKEAEHPTHTTACIQRMDEDTTHQPIVGNSASQDAKKSGNHLHLASGSDDAGEDPPKRNVDLPGKSVEEKLQACLAALGKDGKDRIVATGNLKNSHEEIKKFLRAVIKSKGRKGGRSKAHAPILYICGAPGTGKTSSTLQLCNEALEEERRELKEWEKSSRVSYQNCSILQNLSKADALDKVKRDFKVNTFDRPEDIAASSAMILILDEVDTLIGSKKSEDFFKMVSSWAQDENTQLSLIGISNSIHNKNTSRLVEYGMGGEKLIFQAYRKDELVNITESKIGFGVVDKKAMEFIAAKVAASSGDARRYLELVILAINSFLEKTPRAKLEAPLLKPAVTIKDAMLAIRATNTKHQDIIEGLTTFEKVALCAGVHLARKYDGKSFTMKLLKDLTMDCYGVDNDMELEDFKGVMERLQDNGLLLLPDEERNRLRQGMSLQDLMLLPLKFDLQLEDVESAINDTLMKEGFYKRLVDRVKSLKC
ncbi:AAA domain containing protein [Nitzschia inconspicua]|uniref:AAA domain containing protein n=1 Tax=Nitzschia inconspicua TaxID=303405 RepID=A0A9K3KK62_9STRA|nr:AAA domain containing protein [Nitzschia inconspicua]